MQTKEARFCHLCGKRLVGTYVRYENGLVICATCNSSVPRCSMCGLPSRQLTTARGKNICPACRQKASICGCCRLPILDTYVVVGDSPVRYCEDCFNNQPHCDICQAPLDDQGKTLPQRDGQIRRCSTCLRSAVVTSADAERFYRAMAGVLQREFQLDASPLPRLRVVDRATLVALNREADLLQNSDSPLGPEQHLLGFFERKNEHRTIYIEMLLPRTLFQAVAAHELAHAWQSDHAPSKQPPKIVEGFAEWVAYRALLALGQQQEAARMTRRNDLYGEGLLYFIALEGQRGRQGVIQRAMSA